LTTEKKDDILELKTERSRKMKVEFTENEVSVLRDSLENSLKELKDTQTRLPENGLSYEWVGTFITTINNIIAKIS
jgi:hypothetical protein